MTRRCATCEGVGQLAHPEHEVFGALCPNCGGTGDQPSAVSLRQIIASDAFAASFQTLGQYRTALLNVPVEIRPEVLAFAHLMEAQLRKHDAARGATGWKADHAGDLLRHAEEEWREFRAEVEAIQARLGNPERLAAEAADVGNMAMMIVDVLGGLQQTTRVC